MDYSSYSAFYESMAAISQSHHKKTLIDKYIPMIGMKEKLEEGILVLDVGCGNGFHIFELGMMNFREKLFSCSCLASHFSKSHFVGIDITESAIQQAEEKRKSTNVTNAEFVCLDAKELKSEWKEKFDLVLIFDACHDQCRPDLVRAIVFAKKSIPKSFIPNITTFSLAFSWWKLQILDPNGSKNNNLYEKISI